MVNKNDDNVWLERNGNWKIFLGIIIGMILIGTIFILFKNNPVENKEGIKFYEIANYTNEWDEQYVDEEGYVRINTTRSYYIDRGMEIDVPCECFEELCPFGSHWQDGSKLCYNPSKQMGIVDGIGCRIYVCDKFMVGVD